MQGTELGPGVKEANGQVWAPRGQAQLVGPFQIQSPTTALQVECASRTLSAPVLLSRARGDTFSETHLVSEAEIGLSRGKVASV